MADVFGYTKTAKGPGNVVSPSMVMVMIDGERVYLAQQCTVQYQRSVSPNYELGSDSVWMTAGHSSGTVQLSRAVGDDPLVAPYLPGSACDTQTITVGKGDGACGMDPGTLTCAGCVLANVGTTLSVSGSIVSDSASWSFGNLMK
jgi:hypothetical protein